MMNDEEILSLANLARGAAVERFDDALQNVLDNLRDPDRNEKTARSITLKVAFKPTDDRTMASVSIEVDVKLASPWPVGTRVFLTRKKGKVVALEYNPQQSTIQFEEDGKVIPLEGTVDD